jgi:hypothetical protein
MSILLLSLLHLAHAAEDPPAIDANAFHPAISATDTLLVDDAKTGVDGVYSARAIGQYTLLPFAYENSDGSQVFLRHVLQTDFGAAYTHRGVQYGVNLPIYLFAVGDYSSGEAGTGDMAFEIKSALQDRYTDPVGFALKVRILLPTNSVTAPLGADSRTWEMSAMVDHERNNFIVMGNAGVRSVPLAVWNEGKDPAQWSDQLFLRAAAAYRIYDTMGVSLELDAIYNQGSDNTAGNPVNGFLGFWRDTHRDDITLRAGLGRGLTEAVGSSALQVVVGLAWQPSAAPDRDKDTIANINDLCPSTPEDMDGFSDGDGCPDPSTSVTFTIDSGDLDPVGPFAMSVTGDSVHLSNKGTSFTTTLHPGTYQLSILSANYEPVQREVIIDIAGATTIVTSVTPYPTPSPTSLLPREDE